eukprot:COSAG06_NODE_1053_length_10949_cov_15.790968_2_plen_84_part_00
MNKPTLRFHHFREHRFTSTFMHQDEPAKYSHIHPPFAALSCDYPSHRQRRNNTALTMPSIVAIRRSHPRTGTQTSSPVGALGP